MTKLVWISLFVLMNQFAMAHTHDDGAANKIIDKDCKLKIISSETHLSELEDVLTSNDFYKELLDKGFSPEVVAPTELKSGDLVIGISALACDEYPAKYVAIKKCSMRMYVGRVAEGKSKIQTLWSKSDTQTDGSVGNYGFSLGSWSDLISSLVFDILNDKDDWWSKRASLHCSVK